MRRGFWAQRRNVWGFPARDVGRRFAGAELDQLLHEEHGVASVEIRPAVGPEHLAVERVRMENRHWLGEWEATIPPESPVPAPTWEEFPQYMDRRHAKGTSLSLMLLVDDEIAGLISVGAVEHGAMQSGSLGYWIAEKWAGKGITSLAVAATIDLVLKDLGLHRLEVNIRPENAPSLGIAKKLRLREEAYKPRFMHINNRWADHVGFAIDQEDLLDLPGQSVVEARVRRDAR